MLQYSSTAAPSLLWNNGVKGQLQQSTGAPSVLWKREKGSSSTYKLLYVPMIIFFTQYTVGSNSVTCLQMSKTINLLYSICLLGFVNGGYVVWGGGGIRCCL